MEADWPLILTEPGGCFDTRERVDPYKEEG